MKIKKKNNILDIFMENDSLNSNIHKKKKKIECTSSDVD